MLDHEFNLGQKGSLLIWSVTHFRVSNLSRYLWWMDWYNLFHTYPLEILQTLPLCVKTVFFFFFAKQIQTVSCSLYHFSVTFWRAYPFTNFGHTHLYSSWIQWWLIMTDWFRTYFSIPDRGIMARTVFWVLCSSRTSSGSISSPPQRLQPPAEQMYRIWSKDKCRRWLRSDIWKM